MKAILVVLAALVIACNAASPTICTAYTCVGKGKTCNGVYGASSFTEYATAQCDGSNSCQTASQDFTSSNYTGTCAAPPGNGQACMSTGASLDPRCAAGYSCDPASTTCKPTIRTRYPGQSCSGTDVCTWTNYTNVAQGSVNQCNGGSCLATPDGVTGNCTASGYQCKYWASYCSVPTGSLTGNCAPLMADGSACTADNQCTNQQCIPSASTKTDGKCAGSYSQAAGAFCTGDDQCGGGLFCSTPSGTDTNGKCTAPGSSTTLHKTCTDSTGCAQDGSEYCGCSSSYNKGAPTCISLANGKNIQKDWNNYWSCEVKNTCNGILDTSCLLSHCKSQTCGYFKSLAGDGYNPSAQCGSQCGAGSSVVASVFLVATFAAFLLF